eukprot:973516_1
MINQNKDHNHNFDNMYSHQFHIHDLLYVYQIQFVIFDFYNNLLLMYQYLNIYMLIDYQYALRKFAIVQMCKIKLMLIDDTPHIIIHLMNNIIDKITQNKIKLFMYYHNFSNYQSKFVSRSRYNKHITLQMRVAEIWVYINYRKLYLMIMKLFYYRCIILTYIILLNQYRIKNINIRMQNCNNTFGKALYTPQSTLNPSEKGKNKNNKINKDPFGKTLCALQSTLNLWNQKLMNLSVIITYINGTFYF